MAFKYETGEEIRKGDRVLFHGEPREIEFVVEAKVGDPAMDWYVDEFGGGVMVIEPKCHRTFSESRRNKRTLFLCRGAAS